MTTIHTVTLGLAGSTARMFEKPEPNTVAPQSLRLESRYSLGGQTMSDKIFSTHLDQHQPSLGIETWNETISKRLNIGVKFDSANDRATLIVQHSSADSRREFDTHKLTISDANQGNKFPMTPGELKQALIAGIGRTDFEPGAINPDQYRIAASKLCTSIQFLDAYHKLHEDA